MCLDKKKVTSVKRKENHISDTFFFLVAVFCCCPQLYFTLSEQSAVAVAISARLLSVVRANMNIWRIVQGK